MQVAVIGRYRREIAAIGFDFLQNIGRRVIAVRPAPHGQGTELTFQAQLGLIPGTAPGSYGAVPGNPLLGSRRRGEAQIQVAGLGRELAQGTDCNAIAQVPGSCHCT